jgi:hypothetical protein
MELWLGASRIFRGTGIPKFLILLLILLLILIERAKRIKIKSRIKIKVRFGKMCESGGESPSRPGGRNRSEFRVKAKNGKV